MGKAGPGGTQAGRPARSGLRLALLAGCLLAATCTRWGVDRYTGSGTMSVQLNDQGAASGAPVTVTIEASLLVTRDSERTPEGTPGGELRLQVTFPTPLRMACRSLDNVTSVFLTWNAPNSSGFRSESLDEGWNASADSDGIGVVLDEVVLDVEYESTRVGRPTRAGGKLDAPLSGRATFQAHFRDLLDDASCANDYSLDIRVEWDIPADSRDRSTSSACWEPNLMFTMGG